MDSVFDRPVFAIEVEESLWAGLFWGEACDAVYSINSRLARDSIGDRSADLEGLPNVGKLDVVVQLGTRPDLADFEPAMLLIDRCSLRGEKPPWQGLKYPP